MDDPADGQKRLFFLFNDLSVRTMGEYAIGCFIFDLRRPECPATYLQTESFRVYSARSYPGNVEPDALAKSLALQGVMNIRRKL
ncbi:hypothetical protein HDV03_002798 [Kappamyces sp. JEL0829]|nr:hypothetical protein HDV03_002798 [Kappamyces sp. JEL0829]